MTTKCCTHACNQGRDCPARLWTRYSPPARRSDAAPYLRIVALTFLLAGMMVWGVAG